MRLRFEEKGGKSREIPVRDDLQELLFAYMEAAGITHAPKKAHVLCKTGTKQEIQVVKCELLPRFQGTCMQKTLPKHQAGTGRIRA